MHLNGLEINNHRGYSRIYIIQLGLKMSKLVIIFVENIILFL